MSIRHSEFVGKRNRVSGSACLLVRLAQCSAHRPFQERDRGKSVDRKDQHVVPTLELTHVIDEEKNGQRVD